MDNITEEELKKITRRLDSLQNTLDLLYHDRQILEDIITRVAQLENAIHLNREHQAEVQKNLSADIQSVQHATEDKVDEVKKAIDEQTIVVKSGSNYIFDKLKKMFNIKGNGN